MELKSKLCKNCGRGLGVVGVVWWGSISAGSTGGLELGIEGLWRWGSRCGGVLGSTKSTKRWVGGLSCRSGGGEVLGWWGPRGGVSRCHSIDLLPKFWLLHSSNCTQIVELTMHGQVKYKICTCQFAMQHEKQSPNLICDMALNLITIKRLCLSEVRDPS